MFEKVLKACPQHLGIGFSDRARSGVFGGVFLVRLSVGVLTGEPLPLSTLFVFVGAIILVDGSVTTPKLATQNS